MTDYELTYLFFEIVQTSNGTITNFMTLVFGMLVTSYLAAHRLDRVMMWLALVIYSLFALGFINEIYQASSDFARIAQVIAARGELPGSDLGWFGPVVNGPASMNVIPNLILVMFLSAYAGSIAFFFRARKANLASDIGPPEPGDAKAGD